MSPRDLEDSGVSKPCAASELIKSQFQCLQHHCQILQHITSHHLLYHHNIQLVLDVLRLYLQATSLAFHQLHLCKVACHNDSSEYCGKRNIPWGQKHRICHPSSHRHIFVYTCKIFIWFLLSWLVVPVFSLPSVFSHQLFFQQLWLCHWPSLTHGHVLLYVW